MDIVFKEGVLYLQGVKFGKKKWRKTWMVLFQPSTSRIGRLELYGISETNDGISNQIAPSKQKKAERRVIRLCDILSITPAPEVSCPSGCKALYLNTTLRTYTLASETCDDWLCALCRSAFQKDPGESDKRALERENDLSMEDNSLYSSWKMDRYHVTIQTTEASRRCKLAGEYLLSTDKEAVLLLDIDTGHIIYHWPYTLLRRYGQVKGGVSIEAGHACDSGEGIFTFQSKHGPQIFQAIAKQCLGEQETKGSSVQSPNAYKSSIFDRSPYSSTVQPPAKTNFEPDPSVSKSPDISDDTEIEPYSLYATINHSPAFDRRQMLQKHNLIYSLGADGEEEDGERCQSMEAINLDDVGDSSIYYNLTSWVQTRMKEQNEPESEFSDCIYSVLNIPAPTSQLQPEPLSLSQPSSYSRPQLQMPSYPLPKSRYQPQPQSLVKNQIQPYHLTQDQYTDQALSGEETKGAEEAKSHTPPLAYADIPVSFKEKLSLIISKDLAKFQSNLPSRGGDTA
ncbi:docking protein 1 [Polymixia lowei]